MDQLRDPVGDRQPMGFKICREAAPDRVGLGAQGDRLSLRGLGGRKENLELKSSDSLPGQWRRLFGERPSLSASIYGARRRALAIAKSVLRRAAACGARRL